MNDYDTPEIRCSLQNLSRVTEWHLIAAEVLGQGCWQFRVSIAPFGALDVTCLQDYTTAILREDREDHIQCLFNPVHIYLANQ